MKKLALSVQNPTSYLICMGIKTVENRTWKTDYRGRIYIHSSGTDEYPSLIDYLFPDKLADSFENIAKEKGLNLNDNDDFDVVCEKLKEKNLFEKYQETMIFSKRITEYQENLKRYYGVDLYKEDFDDDYQKKCVDIVKRKGYFHKNFSIIGHVDLVDIVQNSDSVWAEKGCYHWILRNPVLYKNPVLNVKGKLRLFDVSHIDMPDD